MLLALLILSRELMIIQLRPVWLSLGVIGKGSSDETVGKILAELTCLLLSSRRISGSFNKVIYLL